MYVVLACLQGVLLAMATSFYIRDRKAAKAKADEGHGEGEDQSAQSSETSTERSPLLRRTSSKSGQV